MSLDKAQFSIEDVNVESDEVVFDGFFQMREVGLTHRLFQGGWSAPMKREVFYRGDASAAVLYDPKRDLIGLVEQFRIGAMRSEYSPWCLEVVAGMMEAGETAESLIRRELEEEAGISEAELVHITSYYSTPGGCSEKIHLYCALCDLSEAGGVHGLDHENEDILLQVFPAEEVFAVMLDSRMNNAATLLGLQWLQINRKSLK
ncbi:MAG: NUDIX domain-containing protein [Agarilytica sp.]